MSMNLTGRATEFFVKVGNRAVLTITIVDASNVKKSLQDDMTYTTGKWKVWKPDGTLIINGNLTFEDRPNGIVSYRLAESDVVIANAGIWEGEVEIFDGDGDMSEQTKTFNFTIEESY
jgi:hypothetical protein|tara:strand:+ start:2849 stop:3202 length:354 start_codon:yes stop_codon:yes gene_type:complete